MRVWKIRIDYLTDYFQRGIPQYTEYITGCNVIPKSTKHGKLFHSETIVKRMYNNLTELSGYKNKNFTVTIEEYDLALVKEVNVSDK